MSGHSKWSTIKHRKAAKDAKKGKLFSKLIKEVTVAARVGGRDLDANPRLRTAVNTARAASMPSDNVERAIKKGTGELEGLQYEEIHYEGYSAGGAAIMVVTLTDNRNRTVSGIRRLFAKHNGNLGEAGCVAWMFRKRGLIAVDKSTVEEERLIEVALEAGADDVIDAEDVFHVMTTPERFDTVKDAIEQVGLVAVNAEVSMIPQGTVSLTGSTAEQTLKLLEDLEEHDDVQSMASNFDIPQDELDRLSAA